MDDFLESIAKSTNGGADMEEMYIVSLIKHFNISRETVQKAYDAYMAYSKLDMSKPISEYREPPNLDIIFTFDNEIINYYYRFE